MDLQALKAELATGHPTTGRYSDDDVTAAEQLNAANRQPDRESVTAGDIVGAMVPAEYDVLSPTAKDLLRLYVAAGSVPLTDTVKATLKGIFPNTTGPQTRANFAALLKRTGSRAEELGLGRVTSSDVANARRS